MEALVYGYDMEYNGWYAARLTFEQEDTISHMRKDELDSALITQSMVYLPSLVISSNDCNVVLIGGIVMGY